MKKPPALLKIFITAGILSLFLFNVGSVQGASPPGSPDNLSPQANRRDTDLGKSRDQNWLEDQQDKHERFHAMEYLIKERLQQQYQQMEIRENLEENSD